jgi:hypothetical protein
VLPQSLESCLQPGESRLFVGGFVPCFLCKSDKQAEFPAEMILHFQGRLNLNKPGVWVFPKVVVCLDCGGSRFTIPENELPLLAKGAEANRIATE